MERQSSAKAGGSKSVKVHRAGCLQGGGRERVRGSLGCGQGQITRSLLSHRKDS